MVVANIGLLLAKTGRSVCAVDLDLGGADIHILYGLLEPQSCLTDFLTRKVEMLGDIAHTLSSFGSLQVIAGSGDTLRSANMSFQEKQRLLKGLFSLDTDVLLLDVGAGTSYHGLDFFMFSDIQVHPLVFPQFARDQKNNDLHAENQRHTTDPPGFLPDKTWENGTHTSTEIIKRHIESCS